MNDKVFETVHISNIKLKNRIIRSATHEGLTDNNGFPLEKLKTKYISLAKGGVGLIITGYAVTQKNGKASHYGMLMIDDDEKIEHYKSLVNEVHKHDTPIILQIVHCGRQTRSKIIGEPTVAPSPIRDKTFNEDIPKELTDDEIEVIIDNFVDAIIRAKKSGFDGVQLHIAHGFLLSEFLSPYMNRRSDKWGGSIENRFRIIKEIFVRAKEKVNDYPITAKINSHDGNKNGMNIEEAIKVSKMLEDVGCAAIEVSCGIAEDGFYPSRCDKIPVDALLKYHFRFKSLPRFIKFIGKPFIPLMLPKPKPIYNYNVIYAEKIKHAVSIPVIVVGGINSINSIREIIETQKADFVSMSRPFIIEPNIVNKFRDNKQIESKCIYCNYCLLGIEEEPLRCYYGKLKP